MAWTGEWYPYAFSPFLQSFGGDIIDRSTMLTAEASSMVTEAIAFGEWWQSLFERGLAPGHPRIAPTAIPASSMANMLCSGMVTGRPSLHSKRLAMTCYSCRRRFRQRSKIGAGSCSFGISADSEHPDGANAFIEFAIQPKYSAAFSDVLGLAPTTLEAAAMTESYAPGGPLAVFFDRAKRKP